MLVSGYWPLSTLLIYRVVGFVLLDELGLLPWASDGPGMNGIIFLAIEAVTLMLSIDCLDPANLSLSIRIICDKLV